MTTFYYGMPGEAQTDSDPEEVDPASSEVFLGESGSGESLFPAPHRLRSASEHTPAPLKSQLGSASSHVPCCAGTSDYGGGHTPVLLGASPECSVCKETISEAVLVEAIGLCYHVECFRCRGCNDVLPAAFYEQSKQPYCKACYMRLFGQKCNSCCTAITGLVMSAGDQYQYHPECFLCTVCIAPIGENDCYTLIEGSALICGSCSDSSSSKGKMSFKSKSLVQLVHVPPDDSENCVIELVASPQATQNFRSSLIRRRAKRVQVESVRDTGHSLPVRSGDIIVELNGQRVKDTKIEQLQSQLLQLQPTGYNLTVERKLAKRGVASVLSRKPMRQTGAARMRDSPLRHSIRKEKKEKKEPSKLVSPPPSASPPPGSGGEADSGGGGAANGNPKARSVSLHDVLDSSAADEALKLNIFPLSCGDQPAGAHAGLKLLKSLAGDSSMWSTEDSESQDGVNWESSPIMPACRNLRWVRRPNQTNLSANTNGGVPRCYSGVPRCYSGEMLSSQHTHRSPRSVPYSRGLDSNMECSENHTRTIVFRPNDLEIGSIIGKGFFGQVLRVTDRSTGTVMVMKELLRFDKDAQRNFLKEVSLLKSLEHPNVMHFIGIMYRNKMLHLITEYVGGGTLAERLLDKEKELSWSLRVSFGSDIATGMAYLHRHQIIHRDLTSHNCLIRLDGTVVVGDFGLAHQEKNKVGRTSRLSMAVGSAYWMAPEMMKGLTYDHRADIFSYGIILCEIIGRVSADPDELPRSPDFGLDEEAFRRDLLGSCPSQFFDVALECCQMNPLNRPQFPPTSLYLNALCNSLQFNLHFEQRFKTFHSGQTGLRRNRSISHASIPSAKSL